MKVLITGYPGTGKSTTAKILASRGFTTYDTESMPGYAQIEDMRTHRPIALPADPPRHWFNNIGEYNWIPEKIQQLLASPGSCFVCAFTDNQHDFYQYFDRIFVLTLDDATLTKRIMNRSEHDYGKRTNALADILEEHQDFNAKLVRDGAIAISTHQSAEAVADAILRQSGITEKIVL